MATIRDFKGEQPTWCPGCGDYGVLSALQKTSVSLGLEPHEMVLVSGIGCSGKLSSYFRSYGFHSLHGRTLPIATGVKLANRDLTVIAAGGDGDGYGIGIGHLMHAIRRNINITYIVFDNHIYGLTKGQASPTSDLEFKTKTSPYGTVENPVRPVETAVAAGASFVAQGFAGDVNHLANLYERAIQHEGFALVNTFTPCVTFNYLNTYDFFRENITDLDEIGYTPDDRAEAVRVMTEHNRLVKGVIYENKDQRPYTPVNFPEKPVTQTNLKVPAEKWQAMGQELFS